MDTALDELPIAAAHTERLYLASVLIILGLGMLALNFVAIATLSHGKIGSAVASWGAAVAVVACFCGALADVVVGFDLWEPLRRVQPRTRPPSSSSRLR